VENVNNQIASFDPSRPFENSITADRKQNLLNCAHAPNHSDDQSARGEHDRLIEKV
jgi:hypothetical protein